MSSSEPLPKSVRTGTPSVRLVYLALQLDSPASYDDLAARTGSARRAIRRGVRTLEDAGVVETIPDPTAPSKKLFRLASTTETTSERTPPTLDTSSSM